MQLAVVVATMPSLLLLSRARVYWMVRVRGLIGSAFSGTLRSFFENRCCLFLFLMLLLKLKGFSFHMRHLIQVAVVMNRGEREWMNVRVSGESLFD